MKNWWYYHKWYVICGILLLGIACSIIGNACGLWTDTPDFQIAYVGRTNLPPDTVSALEQAFASIASDFNGDGKIIVRVNQYINGSPTPDADTAYYEYASEIALIGDISDCESYFFLLDQPDNFQREFQLLAAPDGDCPEESDYSTGDKIVSWADCPVLSGMELGSYSTVILGQEKNGTNQELLSGLSLGRRCFYMENETEYRKECSELWDFIASGQKNE